MNDETAQNPYAPPEARVSDFQEEAGEAAAPAGRWVRFGGALIDLLLIFAIELPILIKAGFDVNALLDPAIYSGLPAAATFGLSLAWIVVTILLVQRNGQTVGKWLVDIKVVRSDRSRASLGRIFWLRNFVNAIPMAIPVIGLVYYISDHLFIFGPRRQCIHDLIADTIVVDA